MDIVTPIGERNIQEFEADLEIKTNVENSCKSTMDISAPTGKRNIWEFEADVEIKTNIENLMHAKGW